MTRIAVTGGTGLVGAKLRGELCKAVDCIRVLDLVEPAVLGKNESWQRVDITDLDSLCDALIDIDAVVHLAGLREESPIDAIVHINVMGTYNLYEAARRVGIARVVYGSSNHVTGFYPRSEIVSPTMSMRPDTRYALSKCWGELVAGMYFDKHGIETLAIRIGNAADRPRDRRALSMWISARDLANLVMIGLELPELGFRTVYGVSDSSAAWWDNRAAAEIGFVPQDAIADFIDPSNFRSDDAGDTEVVRYFQGGGFCGIEHDGVVRRR